MKSDLRTVAAGTALEFRLERPLSIDVLVSTHGEWR